MTLGVTTEAAGSLLLPQRMGWQAAAHFIFTAGWLSRRGGRGLRPRLQGQRARRRCSTTRWTTARQIGALSVDSLQTTKRLMVAARLDAGRAARQREDAEFVRMVGSGSQRRRPRQVLQLTLSTASRAWARSACEVVGVLEADGHADEAVGDAELGPLRRACSGRRSWPGG